MIAADSKQVSFEYDAQIGKCIYYELVEESKSTLMKYDLTSQNNDVVPVDQNQYIALSSEKDLYAYDNTAF